MAREGCGSGVSTKLEDSQGRVGEVSVSLAGVCILSLWAPNESFPQRSTVTWVGYLGRETTSSFKWAPKLRTVRASDSFEDSCYCLLVQSIVNLRTIHVGDVESGLQIPDHPHLFLSNPPPCRHHLPTLFHNIF